MARRRGLYGCRNSLTALTGHSCLYGRIQNPADRHKVFNTHPLDSGYHYIPESLNISFHVVPEAMFEEKGEKTTPSLVITLNTSVIPIRLI